MSTTNQHYIEMDAPFGTLFVVFSERGVSAVTADESRIEGLGAAEAPPALARALAGGDNAGLTFDLDGLSDFERDVLDKTREIPAGEVRTYAWVAAEIGRPRAVRAVGSALGRNPVPLLIPCHRVVRSDGRAGDYVFGPAAKRALLEAEGAAPAHASLALPPARAPQAA